LAADTRATQDTIVADKNAQKLHPLAQNAWCAGAGTSADLEMVTRLCLYSMALEQLRAHSIGNRRPDQKENGSGEDNLLSIMYTTPTKEEDGNSLLVGRVSLAQVCSFLQEKLWKGQGNLGVNLILGCVDSHKAYLRALHPHGSMDVDLPFAALGSGGLAAMSILERGFHPNLTVTEATELVQAAIVAGIQNDLGSGSQVDLCIIAPDGTSQLTRCVVPSQVLEGIDPPPMEIPLPAEDSAGTNGFGNSPFRIKSRRVLVSTKQENEMEERATLLGL
jgi:20S proteasome subunit beta 2